MLLFVRSGRWYPRVSRQSHRKPIHSKFISTSRQNLSANQVSAANTAQQTIAAFDNTKESYESKSSLDLIRASTVFRLCGWQWLVQNSERLLIQSTKLVGTTLVNAVLKETFFRHFCAGEDETSIRPTVENLRRYGIGGILDYAAEADIAKSDEPDQNVEKNKLQARTYDYEGEAQCDKNVEIFLACIRAVHNVTPEGFAAIKVTALGLPVILERMTTIIIETRKLFSKFDADGNGKVTKEEFRVVFHELFAESTDEEIDAIFRQFAVQHNSEYIDYVEWTDSIRAEEIWNLARTKKGPLASLLDENETRLMHNMFSRIDKIAEYAAQHKVRLMVDAEHTYFQPAIDHVVLNLQRKYNKTFPTIFHTYQCYLKDTFQRVEDDLDRAKRHNYIFAAKIVRGAYLVLERKRAKELNYPDPVFGTIEETHANYHHVLDAILQNIDRANVLVATHNQYSIAYTLNLMQARNISPENGGVYFGQLLGMADHLTFNLGKRGYKAYKYVPYGPVREVVPYLIRRAQENSNVLGNAGKELDMLNQEMLRRMKADIQYLALRLPAIKR